MRHYFYLGVFLLSLIGTTGCDTEEDVEDNETSFAGFVIDQIENTPATSEPVDIQDRDFTDSSDPSAFDSLFEFTY